jgi:hypothetical protein
MSPVTDAMAELQAFRLRLNGTADAISGWPVEQWGGWVVYLLEALQGKSAPEIYEAFLVRLHDRIGDRLRDGEW